MLKMRLGNRALINLIFTIQWREPQPDESALGQGDLDSVISHLEEQVSGSPIEGGVEQGTPDQQVDYWSDQFLAFMQRERIDAITHFFDFDANTRRFNANLIVDPEDFEKINAWFTEKFS